MLALIGHVNSVYTKPDDSGHDNIRNMMAILKYRSTISALTHNRASNYRCTLDVFWILSHLRTVLGFSSSALNLI